jgi:hypothetical protein
MSNHTRAASGDERVSARLRSSAEAHRAICHGRRRRSLLRTMLSGWKRNGLPWQRGKDSATRMTTTPPPRATTQIYEPIAAGEPIRQGDIFLRVPKIDFDLATLTIVRDQGLQRVDWESIEEDQSVQALVNVKSVMAIVISQDCDASRAEDISLCEIRPFHVVDGIDKNRADAPKKWIKLITQHARVNQKWYYLPPSPLAGIHERMAVDFRIPIRVGRENLEEMRSGHRHYRLNEVANAHFRERIAEFFRRYPYDEWYPLSVEEYQEYNKSQGGDIQPFPWQVA